MRRALAGLLILNVALRATWVVLLHPAPQSDFSFYFNAAARLAAGGGYTMNGHPTAYWPIGWPLVLSAFFRVFGAHLWVALALQVLLCSAIAGVVFLIAHRITGSVLAGAVAGLAWTLLPDQLAWTSILGTEPLFTLLALSGVYALVWHNGRKSIVIAGIFLGAACWVRPTLLLFPVVVAIAYGVERRRVLVPVADAALLAVVMLLVIAPLTVRNYIALGSPVLVSTNGGVNLWQGVHVDDRYWWSNDTTVNPLAAVNDEVARDRLGQQLFIAHLVAHPGSVALHAGYKIAALYGAPSSVWWWLNDGKNPTGWVDLVNAVARVLYGLVIFASLIGVVSGWRRWRWPTLLLVGFLTYYTAVFAFFPAWDRFRYPMMPVFAVLVGIAAASTAQVIAGRQKRRVPTRTSLS